MGARYLWRSEPKTCKGAPMKKQTYSSAPASVSVRQSKQRTKAFISALVGRDLGYPEAMKVKRDLVSSGVLPSLRKMLAGQPLREKSLRAKAREAGLPHYVVWNRLDHGWDEARALSTPVGAPRQNCLAARARAVGLPPGMVQRRVRDGMSEEQALSTPPVEFNRRFQNGSSNGPAPSSCS